MRGRVRAGRQGVQKADRSSYRSQACEKGTRQELAARPQHTSTATDWLEAIWTSEVIQQFSELSSCRSAAWPRIGFRTRLTALRSGHHAKMAKIIGKMAVGRSRFRHRASAGSDRSGLRRIDRLAADLHRCLCVAVRKGFAIPVHGDAEKYARLRFRGQGSQGWRDRRGQHLRCYSYYFRQMLSLGVLEVSLTEPGTEATIVWGRPGMPQKHIRVTVAPVPYKRDNRRLDVSRLSRQAQPAS